MPDGQVLFDQVIEISLGLNREVMIQKIIVLRVKLEGRRHLFEGPEVKPLVAEGMNQAPALLVLEHPVDLVRYGLGGEIVGLRDAQEFFIGN